MRLIDADAMYAEWLGDGENEYVYDTNAVLESIDEQPTVDAVPVVRCKDCKYIAEAFDGSPCCKRLWRTAIPYVKEDDFCSYGERKTNG